MLFKTQFMDLPLEAGESLRCAFKVTCKQTIDNDVTKVFSTAMHCSINCICTLYICVYIKGLYH